MTDDALAELATRLGLATAAQLEQARRRQKAFAATGKRVDLLAALGAALAPEARDALQRAVAGGASGPAPVTGATVAPAVVAPPVIAAPPPAAIAQAAAPARIGVAGRWLGPGDRVGPYVVVRELARGGMGVVLEAEQPGAGRRVALKVRLAIPGTDRRGAERFLIEARAAARVRHPGVVAIHDVGEDEAGRQYLAMDLVDGEALDARLSRGGPLDPREAARLCRDMARALAHAHGLGVLHRDLKPGNVIVRRSDGAPLLVDFGLAKLVTVDGPQSLTRTGEVMGTPSHMPPEQATGDRSRVDARSDVWSLGATLYHLVVGHPPFEGPSVIAVLAAVIKGGFEPPRAARPDVPVELEAIVLRCLTAEPEGRYPSMTALADDLERFLSGAEPEAAASARADRRARGLRASGVALAGLGVALAAAFGVRAALAPPEARPSATSALDSTDPPAASSTSSTSSTSATPSKSATAATTPTGPTRPAGPEAWIMAEDMETVPPQRYSHGMVYDARRQVVVLFGGRDDTRLLDDQWTWDGRRWTEEHPARRPKARHGLVMAWDAARDRIVLHGGCTLAPPAAEGEPAARDPPTFDDTWVWRAGEWTDVTATVTTAPGLRGWHGMTYDPARGRCVLLGGAGPGSELHAMELWALADARWERLEPGPGEPPPARRMFGVAWSERRDALVVIGGGGGIGAVTWTWTPGAGWSHAPIAAPPDGPGDRNALVLVDTPRGVFYFSGRKHVATLDRDDAWLIGPDGTWSRRLGDVPDELTPQTRKCGAGAWDSTRGVVVLFGGLPYAPPFMSTWEYRPGG